jgi:hypothetical protein
VARNVKDEAGVPTKATALPGKRVIQDHANLRDEPASLAYVKQGKERRTVRRAKGITFTVSFTVTKELDQLVHDLAIEGGVSRSSVARSAILHYARAKGKLP